MEMEKS